MNIKVMLGKFMENYVVNRRLYPFNTKNRLFQIFNYECKEFIENITKEIPLDTSLQIVKSSLGNCETY